MRTTINLPDDLLSEAKGVAAASARTFTQLVEKALRAPLARRTDAATRCRVRSPTAPGALRPGVDLDDSGALLDSALAIESGSEWITADRDDTRFPGLRWRHPLGP